MLDYWILMSLDEARTKAMEVLRQYRNAERPSRHVPQEIPTMRETYVSYCKAKSIKPYNERRYESFYRTHFGKWLDRPVSDMAHGAFTRHCRDFSQTKFNVSVALVRLISLETPTAGCAPRIKM